MRNVAALSSGLLVFFMIGSVVNGQAPLRPARTAASVLLPSAKGQEAPAQRRTSALVCEMNAFFSIEPEDRVRKVASLDGRGLMNCQNEQGFSSEVPILADLEVELPADLPVDREISLSGNSSTFVIPRDIAQLQDTYSPRTLSVGRAPASLPTSTEGSTVLLRGRNHDLVVQMDLTSQTTALDKLKVKSMRLRFDDSAPDLD